jgi:hypothetical protein
MKKIPVGPTIASAYRFLVTEIGTIVGIAWLPAVLSSTVSYFARAYAVENRALLDTGDPQAAGIYLLLSLASLLVLLFASSMVAVAITRAVMGQERPAGALLLYFAAGPAEWRMLAANVRYLFGAGALVGLAVAISVAAFFLSGTPLDAPEQVRATPATIPGWSCSMRSPRSSGSVFCFPALLSPKTRAACAEAMNSQRAISGASWRSYWRLGCRSCCCCWQARQRSCVLPWGRISPA